jgi:putative endonuclease
MNTRQDYEEEGRKAERRVVHYLRLRGYKILAERFKTPDGEADIIAQKGTVIAIVEVKQRATKFALDEAMDSQTERRVMAAAEIWVERHFQNLPKDFELRFDFAGIIGKVTPFCRVHYLKHAFRPD